MRNPIAVAFLVLWVLVMLGSPVPVAAQEEDEEPAGETAIHAPKLPPSDYYLPRGTIVEIELLETLDSATAKRNQVFHYKMTRDVAGEGGVVVARGTEGRGWVIESRKGTKAATPRLHLNFGEVVSVEGRPIQLGFTEPARKANENVAGLTAVIGGYFEGTGRSARIEAGTKILTAVEFPYGTRKIKSGEEGVKYHLFSDTPVQE
ncbi:MAG: hypothetical protein HY814_13945 [Candidatus Riflebacteria bacterium]|nr:hypothetical protein [Candidatus Riflebacteria bacterium]